METETWLTDAGVYLRPVVHRKQIVDFINELGLEGNRIRRIEIAPDTVTVTYFYKEKATAPGHDHEHFVLSPDMEGPLTYLAIFQILPDEPTEETDSATD